MKFANNELKKWENSAEHKSHYSIRKLTIGAASVLLGTTLWLGKDATVVHAADENTGNDNEGVHQATEAGKSTPQVNANTKVVVQAAQADSASKASSDQASVANNQVKQDQTEAKPVAQEQQANSAQVKDTTKEANIVVKNDTNNNTNKDQKAKPVAASNHAVGEPETKANTDVVKSQNQNGGVQTTNTLNISKHNVPQNFVSLFKESKASTDSNGGFDEDKWGKLDVNDWQGEDQDGYYQLTGYTGDYNHVIVPNEADFENAGIDTNGEQVGVTSDFMHDLFKKATSDEATVAFSKTDDDKVKAIDSDWSNTWGHGTGNDESDEATEKLEYFDGSNLDVSDVTNMNNLFRNNELTDMTSLQNWDISQVVNVSGMLSKNRITDLTPLENWDTSQVNDMSNMFADNEIEDLTPIKDWDISQVSDLSGTFKNNQIANLVPVQNWDTGQVHDLSGMFENNQITDLAPIQNWNTSQVSNMSGIFENNQITDLAPIQNWDISQVNDMSSMFEKNKITDLTPLSNWNTSYVTNMENMFSQDKISDLDPVSNWNMEEVANLSGMFELNQISDLRPIANWNVANVKDMSGLFFGNPIENADFSNWNFTNISKDINGIKTGLDVFINPNSHAIIYLGNNHTLPVWLLNEQVKTNNKNLDNYNIFSTNQGQHLILTSNSSILKNPNKSYNQILFSNGDKANIPVFINASQYGALDYVRRIVGQAVENEKNKLGDNAYITLDSNVDSSDAIAVANAEIKRSIIKRDIVRHIEYKDGKGVNNYNDLTQTQLASLPDMDKSKFQGNVTFEQLIPLIGTGYYNSLTGQFVQIKTDENGNPIDKNGNLVTTDSNGDAVIGELNNGTIVPKIVNNQVIKTSYIAIRDSSGNLLQGGLRWAVPRDSKFEKLTAPVVSGYKVIPSTVPDETINQIKTNIQGIKDNNGDEITSPTVQQILNYLNNQSTQSISTQGMISDPVNYPQISQVPKNQYIFEQFKLTELGDSNPSDDFVFTLTVNRDNPRGGVYMYVTDSNYNTTYWSSLRDNYGHPIPVGGYGYYFNHAVNHPFEIKVHNFGGSDGNCVSVNITGADLQNTYSSDTLESEPSDSWGCYKPREVTQTVKFIDDNTGKEIAGYPELRIKGLIGQQFNFNTVSPLDIAGYKLKDNKAANGIISDYVVGKNYIRTWFSREGVKVTEQHKLVDNNGTMHTKVLVNGQFVGEGDIPRNGSLSIAKYGLDIQNPYVPSTANVVLRYKKSPITVNNFYLTYIPQELNTLVTFKDVDPNASQDSDEVKNQLVTQIMLKGKSGESIDLTKVIIPTNFVLDGNLPSDKKFGTDETIVINVKHQTHDVSNKDPLAKLDIIRTITVINPDNSNHDMSQTTQLHRSAILDLVTNKTTYGNWNTSHFDQVNIPSIPGYVPSQAIVPAVATVTSSFVDPHIRVIYTAENSDESTQIISYVNDNGVQVGQQVVKGKIGDTFHITPELPDGYDRKKSTPVKITIEPNGEGTVLRSQLHQSKS